MTALPGSLDHLYYNGILDHIPYEAYEMAPMTPSGMLQASGMGTGMGLAYPQMNGSQYLQAAQQGYLYDTYTYPDTFVRRASSDIKNEQDFSMDRAMYGEEGKNFRQVITEAAAKTKETVANSPNWAKGVLAGGIMLTTLFCLLRGKKPPKSASTTSFWAKLNPINWFKK